MTDKNNEISFEEALNQLEKVTEKLKEGNATLEESLKLYDEGVKYYKVCSDILEYANQKILYYDKEMKSFKEAD